MSLTTLAVAVFAFVPAQAQELPQDPATDPVEEPRTPPKETPAEPPADPAPTPEPAPAPGPVDTPSTDEAAVATELPAPAEVADPAGDYRLDFHECAYDATADETTCTWQLTDSFGNTSAPGGVTHVALDTCLGPDATPLPADDDLILGAMRWDVTYDAPDLALDPNQPPVDGWTWDLSEGQIPVGAELSLVKSGEILGTGTSDYVLKNDDEFRTSDSGPLCPSTVSRLETLGAPSTLAAPGDAQTVTIRKQTTPGGDPQLFNFVLQKCSLSSTSSCNANPANWVTVTNGSQNLADNGVFTWGNDNTAPGTLTYDNVRYRVLETTPAGWTFVNLTSCTTGLPNFTNVNSGNQHGASFRLQDQNGSRFLDCTWNNAVAGQATIRAFKGGDRTAVGGGVGTLNGATFNVYDNAGLVGPPVGSCTTGAPFPAGQCDVSVDADQDYWVAEASSPSPFNVIPELTITSGGTQDYAIAITAGQVGEGETALAPPNQSGYQRRFANRRNNATFPTTCGVSIALLIDNSNSISSGELTQMKDAALDFSNGLTGTGSPIGVYRFGSTAATLQTPTTNTANVNTAINSIGTGGGATNWDDAFQEVSGSGVDIVIMMTDGNPTISNVGGSGSTTTFWDIEEGVASANLVKSQGPKVLALGVGADVSPLNLQAISGPIQGPVDGNYDYAITDFDTIAEDLIEIATQLCGAQINVTKLLDGQPAANWVFTPTSPGGSGITFNPSPTGTTGANGQVGFTANPIPANGSTVTLTESLAGHPNTSFQSATCLKNGQPIGNQGVNSVTFPIARQDTINCTFNNVTNPGQITVVKDATPNSAQSFSFSGTGAIGNFNLVDNGGPNSQTFPNLTPGTYNITETVPAGWDLTSASCTSGGSAIANGVAVSLPAGGNITCTFQNRQRGQITVVKDATPNSAQSFSFSGTAPIGNFNLVDNGGPNSQTFPNLVPGTFNITETVPAGWDLTSASCTSGGSAIANGVAVSLPAGGNITCTFQNRQRGQITVVKDATPNSAQSFSFSGTAPIGNFNLVDNGGPNSQTFTNLVPGTFNITETVPAGWDLTSASCTSGGSAIANGVAVSLPAGGNITCTFQNRQRGQITVVKDATPNSAQSFSFSGTAPIGNFNLVDNGGPNSQTFTNLVPGTFNITETVPAGWNLTNASCTSGGSAIQNGVAVNLPAGANITCTFTNTQRGQITIVKDATPNSPQSFGFTGDLGPFNLVDNGGPNSQTFSNLVPGTFNITETVPAGWNLTSATCTSGGSPIANGVSVSLPAGANITCTFTNTQRGQITIVKDATPNSPQSFGFTSTLGPFNLVDNGGPNNQTFTNLDPGNYSFTETVPAGWDLTNATCTSGGSAIQNGVAVNLPAGGDITCTFNNRQRGQITVVKDANPNSPQSFSFSGTGAIGNFNLVDNGGPNSQTFTNLVPGTFNITETVPAGWNLTSATCTSGGSPIQNGVSVSLPAGGDITCTFTNALNTADVKVIKLVDGVATSGWTFGAQTTPPTTVTPPSGATDAQGAIDFDLTHVLAGGSSLTITETLQDGYSLDGATCATSDQQNVPINVQGLAGTLTVNPGQNITCTFSNSANTATINLYKIVDDIQTGGWTMNASVPGAGPARFTPGNTTNAQGQTDANNPLTFNLTKVSNDGTPVTIDEVLQPGYSFDNIDCPASEHPPFSSDSRPGVITVNDGDVWDCTFENVINEASLTVVKEVDDQPAEGWTFGATSVAPTTIDPASGATNAQGEVDFSAFLVLDGGSPVTITETLQPGYTLVGATCVDSEQQNVPIDLTNLSGTLTMSPGDDITCTFDNATLPPSISITKTAEPPIVLAGNDVTYTLTVVNDGEVDLTNVVVTDPLAPELTPVSAEPSKGSCNLAQTITCNIGNLAVDEEVTIEIVATVDADTTAGTLIDNVASVTGDPPVGPPVEDEDSVTVDVSQSSPTTVVPTTSGPGPGPGPGPVPGVVSGTLPFTGSMASMLLKGALWLLGIGALLVFAVRRRRRMAA